MALASTGKDIGTPIIQFQPPAGVAFFGPVISRLHAQPEAVPLWDHVLGLASFLGFAELKRSGCGYQRERDGVGVTAIRVLLASAMQSPVTRSQIVVRPPCCPAAICVVGVIKSRRDQGPGTGHVPR